MRDEPEAPGTLEIGYDVPAAIGMAEADVHTPCLIVDLEAFERNIEKMRAFCDAAGISLRAHGKMHKCPAVARYQIDKGGASGICCQKVSEAEAFIRGGIRDVLVSNQVTHPAKVDRLAQLPLSGARVLVCCDDPANVPALSAAARRHGTRLEVLVEIDCGAGRCGAAPGAPAAEIATAIDEAPALRFAGLQAYHGNAQHHRTWADRQDAIAAATKKVRDTLSAFADAGLEAGIVGGGGTGSYPFETASGLYTELQCGSYAFMDADYGMIEGENGGPLTTFDHALFVLTSVMSTARPGHAVVDAGHKASAIDSGLPMVFGRDDLIFLGCSDEHGQISDPVDSLSLNDRLRLVPGHCDPTCNLHDWLVGIRNGVVETVWPITARGKGY